MSYRIEEVNGCNKKLIFDFQEVDLTNEVATELKRKQQTVVLKGFRKGKAPLSMIEKLFRFELEDSAYRRFISNQFYSAVEKENLKVVGNPQFSNVKYSKEEGVSFEAMVEIFPEIDVTDFSSIKVDESHVEVTAEDIEKVKTQHQTSKAELKEISDESRKIEKGHLVVINYQGEKDNGEKPESMKGEEFLLEIGAGRFIPGFEEGLIGAVKGDKKVLELTFPESYHDKTLENAKVKFEVEVLEIKERILPAFDDGFVKQMGHQSVEEFENKLRENILQQKTYEQKQKVNQSIIEQLVKENPFEVPASLIAMQRESIVKDISKNLLQQGFQETMLGDYYTKWHKEIDEKAVFQVKSGIILEKLAEKFQVTVSSQDLDQKYEIMAKSMGIAAEEIKKYYSSNKQVEKNLRYAIREEKTFEAILAHR